MLQCHLTVLVLRPMFRNLFSSPLVALSFSDYILIRLEPHREARISKSGQNDHRTPVRNRPSPGLASGIFSSATAARLFHAV